MAGFDRAPETDAYALASDVTQAFGSGEITPIGRLPFEEIEAGPLALLDAAATTPTVTVRLGQAFRERRREQREQTLELFAKLGQVCSVAIVTTSLTARWLGQEHRSELPIDFSEHCNAGGDSDSPIAEIVGEAFEQLDTNGRAVRMLRDIEREPAETLSYHELQAIHSDVSNSRVSQLVSNLSNLQLVEKYGKRGEEHIDLLPAGRAYLDTLDEQIGRQQRLDANFSETGQSPQSDVLAQPHKKAPQDSISTQPVEREERVPFRTRYLDRATHHGIAAAATDSDIVAVNTQTMDNSAEKRRTRFVSYDEQRDEAIVAVHASTPLQYAVSVALSLASPRLFDKALPGERLEEIDDPPAILRDARCIGGLSNEALEDSNTLRENLIAWGENLEDMTTKLQNGEYENRNRFCGEILRSAHGLAGTVVHLLDVAGVDVVRELRIPSLSDGQMEQLAKTVAIASTIQSRYGAFAAYRQLFESRDEKRKTALSPDVDATEPLGTHIGSLVIRGRRAERFGYHVEGTLSNPATMHEDAPEFSVPVTVSTPSRPSYTAAVNRMLRSKNIRATPEAASLFEALTSDVFAVTEAIHWLGKEEEPRTIRLDEVRVSLAALDSKQLLGDAPPSLSKAVAVLLRSVQPLSVSDLAEKAGISTRSLRRHIEPLVTLDVVRETDDGFRLALPFEDERETIAPAPLTEDCRVTDVVFDLAIALVDDAGRLGNPDDPVGQPFFGAGFDPRPLRTHLPDANPYLSVALSLCNYSETAELHNSTVAFGPQVEQVSITGATSEAVAD